MSWAEEDWTVGLSGRVLLKVKELQVQQDRLSRENKQRQLQLDNSQDALNKQKIKHEEVRRELQILQRELKGVQEDAQAQTSSAQRLSLELQTRQTLVCSLEGQLDAARTLTQNLTLEVKRLEAELEKLQTSQEAGLFSTPCWNTTSPWEHNAGKQKEERTGQRGDGDSRSVRQQLQFSDAPTGSLPRQGGRAPQRHSSDQSDIFSTPMAVFPWERDDSKPPSRGRGRAPTPQAPPADPRGGSQPQPRDRGRTEDVSKEADACASELRGRIGAVEAELRAETNRLKASQDQLGRSQKELAAAETSLQKSRDQISQAQTRTLQETDRASVAEQKVKKLQEELKCQGQNAESSRLQHQQRTKELEKQHQMDVSELQKERQRLEKQQQQEVTKLNQELQQARVLHNTLQAQAEKLSLQKQTLEREVEALKAKLKWTEGQLQESEKKEAQTQAKLTEALREAQGVAASLEQSTRRGKSLEEEGRRATQERDDALLLLKELREQNAALALPAAPIQPCSLGHSFSPPEPRPSGPGRKPPGEQRPGQGRGCQAAPKYPMDREPGEGLDAEHMTARGPSTDSESPQGSRPEGDDVIRGNRPGSPKIHAADPPQASLPPQSEAAVEAGVPPKEPGADALRKENAALASDLRDAREELQRRLEDLETQRRAEAEARTRLKQLSKKRTGREAELEEQERETKGQLERERSETERLRKALATLQAQLSSKERAEVVEEEEEARGDPGSEDREQELVELNIQMKAQLSEARAQLALEREERQREEEERAKAVVSAVDAEEKAGLSGRLAELEAELEELKRRGQKDAQRAEADAPLTYLALCRDDKLNANIAALCPGLDDNQSLLPSPELDRLFCLTANQLNAAASQAAASQAAASQATASQATAQLILKGDQVAELLPLPLLSGDGASPMEGTSPELEDSTPEELSGASDCPETPSPPDLAREVARLQEEKTGMARLAGQSQARLQALQAQVTRQTQQLTMAFELQSQHIRGLLVELQEKEGALLRQGGELQGCRQELAQLMAQTALMEGDRAPGPIGPGPELHTAASPSEPSSRDTVKHIAGGDKHQASERSSDSEAGAPSPGAPKGIHAPTADPLPPAQPARICSDPGREGGGGTAAQTPASRSETLPGSGESGVEGPPASDARGQDSDPGPKTDPCRAVSRTPGGERERQGAGSLGSSESSQELTGSRDDGVGREDPRKEEKDPLVIVSRLEKQVVALQAELRTVSEVKEKQAEELVLWRLASPPSAASRSQEPSPGLKDPPPSLNGPLRRPESSQPPRGALEVMAPAPTPGAGEPEVTKDLWQDRGTLTVIREDQLILSCSSKKIQGTMLTCRVQQSDPTEPKSVFNVEKTFTPQGSDDLIDDEGSDKENMDGNRCLGATTKSPPPPPHGALVRASSDPRRGPRDATPGPPQTKASQRAEQEATPTNATQTNAARRAEQGAPSATPAASQRETSSGRPSLRSAATQTHASPLPTGAAGPPLFLHACTQTEEEVVVVAEVVEEEVQGRAERLLFSGSFPIPADPARLAERIRRNRSQLSAAFDDTEYEPYGLPEVVMKGFADIPSGNSCPYIVRRGLLGTPAVPLPPTDTPPREETD
ncbi:unnamed protein product [Boreogadus saida]